jgi:GT2 family glycosyltransferase
VAPNVAVIPVRDQVALTTALVSQLVAQDDRDEILVLDNGSTDATRELGALHPNVSVVDARGLRLSEMWQLGADLARQGSGRRCNIAFLNNDLRIGPGFTKRLSCGLRSRPQLWAVSPRYRGAPFAGVRLATSTFKNGGLAGFAFMTRGEIFDTIRFDADFEWWYGDDDLVAQIEQRGGRVGIVGDTTVEHINGGSQTIRYTPTVRAAIDRDRARMRAKWGRL